MCAMRLRNLSAMKRTLCHCHGGQAPHCYCCMMLDEMPVVIHYRPRYEGGNEWACVAYPNVADRVRLDRAQREPRNELFHAEPAELSRPMRPRISVGQLMIRRWSNEQGGATHRHGC